MRRLKLTNTQCITQETIPDDKDILNFWHSSKWNSLRIVAARHLNFSVSSGGIECDFGVCGSVLRPTRANLDAVTFDMSCTLRRNIDRLPHVTEIPPITRKEMKLKLLDYQFRGTSPFRNMSEGMQDMNLVDRMEFELYDDLEAEKEDIDEDVEYLSGEEEEV